MSRQVLPLIDLRGQAERQGITRNMQTARAIAGILQTVGQAEQKRREGQTLDRITRAMLGGATVIEAIGAAQKPEFSSGISGALQRFGGLFQPSPGGMDKSIQQAIIGQKIQSEYGTTSPSQMINTERLKKYYETEDPSWIQPGLHIRPPTEAQDLSGKELSEYLEELRRKRTEKPSDVPLTEPQVGGYGDLVDKIIKKLDRFRPGFKDFSEKDMFKEWQKFNGMYQFKNDTQREQVWNLFKNKVNKLTEGLLGKEIDWDPTDPKWREAIGLKGEIESKPAGKRTFVTDKYPAPKNKEEFDRTLAGIEAGKNEEEADFYYDKHWKLEYGTHRQ